MVSLILIALTGAVLGYIISSTSAIESYHKLLLRLTGLTTTVYDNPMTAKLDFWMKLGLKYPQSFLVALGSCGICSSVFASILLGFFYELRSFVVIGGVCWLSIVLYCVLKKMVSWSNSK